MNKRRTERKLAKLAKKRGFILVKIKLAKMKPTHLCGSPTPRAWEHILSARDPVQAVREVAGNAVATEFERFFKL